jgi:biotin transport system substrate-specific component
VRCVAALLMGNIFLYAIGVPWLKSILHISWASALAAGLTPFMPGMVIKIAVAAALGRVFLTRFHGAAHQG